MVLVDEFGNEWLLYDEGVIVALDYSKDCAACSTPMASPPRDGPDSMCAYLHTRAGRRDFERNMKRNRATKRVVDRAETVTSLPDEATQVHEVTLNEVTLNEVTLNEVTQVHEATHSDDEVTGETKSQRYNRLHRDEINQRQRDRRNGLSI